MKRDIHAQQIRLGRLNVLCDSAFEDDLTADLFDPLKLEKAGVLNGKAQGRGEAWFIRYRGHSWVLRHFRRGGLVGRFVNDCYFGWNLERTRAWAEWRLLDDLYCKGLPVPRPVAAAVQRGFGFYRADLLTELIPDSQSLSARLTVEPQSEDFWKELGVCLRRFHDEGVYHADLNAKNILIDACSQVFLIDFDRGAFRPPGAWMQNNLQRLKRSLLKMKGVTESFYFEETEWQLLLEGYDF